MSVRDAVGSSNPAPVHEDLPSAVYPKSDRLTTWMAALLAIALPIRAVFPVASSVMSVGVIIAVILLPVIAVRASNYRYTGIILSLIACSLLSAPLLMAAADRQVDYRIATIQIAALAFSAISLLALLWIRSAIGSTQLAIYYSMGLVVEKVLTRDNLEAVGLNNTWKYAFAFPVTVLLLAVAAKSRRDWTTIAVLVLITGLSVQNGHRSFLAISVITLGAFLWTRRPILTSREERRPAPTRSFLQGLKTALALGATSFGVYQGFIWLALNGYLGRFIEYSTRGQAAKGELLATGRTENAAAWRLFIERPTGYGPGAAADAADVAAGQAGLVSRRVNLESSGIDDYVFGQGTIKLHSVISDLWVQFGIAGLLLGCTLLMIVGGRLVRELSNRGTGALTFFLATSCLWNLLFSPILSNFGDVIFAVALLLPIKTPANRDRPITTHPNFHARPRHIV
jgi:hypothetical protein